MKFKDSFNHYRDYAQSYGVRALGDCVITEGKPAIVHLFGQQDTGRDRCHTEYGALEKSLIRFNAKRDHKRPVAVPFGLGCGLAGGDWKIVGSLLDRYLPEATIYKLPVKLAVTA
jgi:hypothetical protein